MKRRGKMEKNLAKQVMTDDRKVGKNTDIYLEAREVDSRA